MEKTISRPKRRLRQRPEPGMPLIVERPQIDEVLDVEAGTFISAMSVIGNDYVRLVQLRMEVRSRMRRGTPLYKCATCGVAVHICCSRDAARFFFKHRHEDGNCPAVTAGVLNQAEIDARKYNGAKESRLHLQMKEWLVRSLSLDGRFSDIRVEQVWKGAWTSQWRKPDVQAVYDGQRIAFEIQLSTTFLDVIAGRRDFYLAEGGLLFWIFARFDTDRLRMTDDDVFYNNNTNAFVINAQTLEASTQDGVFQLECIWSIPHADGGLSGLNRKTIRFDELTLDAETQRAFYFDCDAARRVIQERAQAANQKLRQRIEQLFGDRGFYGDDGRSSWEELRHEFARAGVPFVRYARELPYDLLQGLYSAKHGRPFASKRKLLVEAAHRMANGGRHLRWFSKALRHYGRGPQLRSEDRSGNWAKKVKACRELELRSPEMFEPDRKQQALVEFLFPELCPLP
jgi:hypothetical protein